MISANVCWRDETLSFHIESRNANCLFLMFAGGEQFHKCKKEQDKSIRIRRLTFGSCKKNAMKWQTCCKNTGSVLWYLPGIFLMTIHCVSPSASNLVFRSLKLQKHIARNRRLTFKLRHLWRASLSKRCHYLDLDLATKSCDAWFSHPPFLFAS